MKKIVALVATVLAVAILFMSCAGSASRTADGVGAVAVDSTSVSGDEIQRILADAGATAGVAVICGDDTVTVGNDDVYPLMSVFKLHIAVAILRGHTPLDSVVHVGAGQLRENTYSPLRDKSGGKDIDITVDRLMWYSVVKSDNNACDLLIDIAGGIQAVDSVVQCLHLGNVKLTETEDSMHADIMRSYNNCSSPLALATLMSRLYNGDILDEDGTVYLTGLLNESTTGREKLAAGIPAEHFLGHKSGLSDRTPAGMLIASGDVAAFSTAGGRTAFVAVLVKDNNSADSCINRIFADVAMTVFKTK